MIDVTPPSVQTESRFKKIERVGVAGSGTMGIQLVTYLLSRNLDVTLFTRNPIEARINLNNFIKKRYPSLASVADSNRLIITSNFETLCENQIVLESIKENLEIKRDFIKRILETNSEIIIGSCTSSLTLKQLTNGLCDKGKVNVIHFSNPVAKMKVIEFVPSIDSSESTKATLKDFFSCLEHRVFEIPDVPGYVINIIIFSMIEKANFLVNEYGVSREDVDDLLKLGCGFPMGPFEIEKLIGAETVKLIRKNLAIGSKD
jgi:3-hydroxybutyryl-CoA dehydrogenase